ncbi:polyketide synthase [Streptomyces flavofungini]|uniref:polyketide synthase n=1 Tax=Streptomyces flavofungini TaxID=68200 RepID=UPI0025AF323F|nr:polyketide synthase [Streptomyces flavofungini]WJV44996.1 polyketide synthase [Streptomyces flavofungini]
MTTSHPQPPRAAAPARPGEPVAVVGVAALDPGTLDDVVVDVARFGIPPLQARSMNRMQLLMLEAARRCLADADHPERPLPAERTDVVAGLCFALDRQHANALRVELPRYAREVERAAVAAGTDPDSAARAGDELRELLTRRLGGSPHDRVGEMASTIPARIAAAFKLHGRTLAVESAEATSFVALAHALEQLRAKESDAVLVLTGQRDESPYVARALAAKSGAGSGQAPPDGPPPPRPLTEGVGAVLLKRLSDAVRDQDRVYATILDCTLRHDPQPGCFRPSRSAELRQGAAAASLRAAGVDPDTVQYVEYVDSAVTTGGGATTVTTGVGATTVPGGAETTTSSGGPEATTVPSRPGATTSPDRPGATTVPSGPGATTSPDRPETTTGPTPPRPAPGPVALGSGDGRAFAHAGLAALTKVALALHQGRYPGRPGAAGAESDGTAARVPGPGAPWQAGVRAGVPRRAVVQGASLTGTFSHLVLEEHPGPGASGPRAGGGRPVPRGRTRRAWAAATRAVPVAVVGLGGRFAGAADAAGFWRVVSSGRTRIGPVPDAVLDRELYHSPGALSLTYSYTDQGGHVPVPDEPPEDLGVLPPRYAALDGAQRLALAVAAELFAPRRALSGRGVVAVGGTLGLTRERQAHAGLVLDGLDDTIAGLPALAGLSALGRKRLLERLRERTGRADRADGGSSGLPPALLDGCLASGVAALLANEYGLDAVPLAVEAACASSLAALDIAVGALRSGTADYAVAGGVELACNVRDMVLCSALGLLSHSRNAPFDAGADGFTPGDGCGLFLLKRYDDALRDGDTVHGVIRAVGASNDAKSLIAPDVAGQVRAMQRAFAQVDFEPCTVDYLEAHGTGTKVGDRVEIAAAARLYAGGPRAEPLRIGSAKSFFGHTFAAAGSAGLLRTLLALRAGTLPPNTLLRTLNPALGLAAVPAEIRTDPQPWARPPGRPRRAAVSSFGTGGINYHVLVEEHREEGSGPR